LIAETGQERRARSIAAHAESNSRYRNLNEREIMLERQREGIAAAKVAGKYKGRKPTAMAKSGEVKELLAQGMTKQATADRLGIGVASVYRIYRELMEINENQSLAR
jgi:DNA invertase Pin-like site-specific DNA recombinase